MEQSQNTQERCVRGMYGASLNNYTIVVETDARIVFFLTQFQYVSIQIKVLTKFYWPLHNVIALSCYLE